MGLKGAELNQPGVQSRGSSLTAVPAAPTIEFEEAAYQVREPLGPEAVAVLAIPVLRRGDRNRTSKVRCSTRDGSAQAGLDYYPKSRMLKFSPGKGASWAGLEVGARPEHPGDLGKATFRRKLAVTVADVLNEG